MKGDASLFAFVDLGSNAFRMMNGQRVLRDKRLVIEKIKTPREPVRLAEALQDNAATTDPGNSPDAATGILPGFRPCRRHR